MFRALTCALVMVIFVPQPISADGNTDVGRYFRIESIKAFRDNVADRRMSDRSGNWSVAYRNGKLQGEYDGVALRASWSWKQNVWCRKGSLGGTRINDCWRLDLKGDTLKVTPSQGGRAMQYRLK